MLDGAVVVFDGVAGVEPQSETNWRYADEGSVPRICFINKLDRTGASFERSFASILDRLTKMQYDSKFQLEEEHMEGVVDLLKMAYAGKHGFNTCYTIKYPQQLFVSIYIMIVMCIGVIYFYIVATGNNGVYICCCKLSILVACRETSSGMKTAA